MILILMRHGRAEERLTFAADGNRDDGQRPLTKAGRKRLLHALPGMGQILPPLEQVVSSPLVRARQTAEMVAERFGLPMAELDELAPGGDPQALNHWLGQQKSSVVLMVGHEPDLGALASWYLTGSAESFIALKKGAIVQLGFAGQPAAGQGELQLLLSSAQLRSLTP